MRVGHLVPSVAKATIDSGQTYGGTEVPPLQERSYLNRRFPERRKRRSRFPEGMTERKARAKAWSNWDHKETYIDTC